METVSCLFSSFLGVIPSTDFLKSSGVPLSSRGDVVVDKVGLDFCDDSFTQLKVLLLSSAKKTRLRIRSFIMYLRLEWACLACVMAMSRTRAGHRAKHSRLFHRVVHEGVRGSVRFWRHC